jgi:hypothetical protein
VTDFEHFLWGMLARHPLETLDPFTLSQGEPTWAQMCLARFKTPEDVLIFVWQSAHEHVISTITPGAQGQDYLFDYLLGMADYLTPYKETTRSLAGQMVQNPCVSVRLAPFAAHWAELVLTSSELHRNDGLDADYSCEKPGGLSGHKAMQGGLRNIIQRYSFIALTLWLFYQWLKDDTPDLSPTMVAVDNALQKWLNFKTFRFV